MNSVVIVAATVLWLKIICYFFRKWWRNPRTQALSEIRWRLSLFRTDSFGDGAADVHVNELADLMITYHISPLEVDCQNMPEIAGLARESFKRFVESYRQQCNENWSHEIDDNELCLCIPHAEGHDDADSVNLYAQSQRKLRRLNRKLNLFHVHTRKLRGFFISVDILSIFPCYPIL